VRGEPPRELQSVSLLAASVSSQIILPRFSAADRYAVAVTRDQTGTGVLAQATADAIASGQQETLSVDGPGAFVKDDAACSSQDLLPEAQDNGGTKAETVLPVIDSVGQLREKVIGLDRANCQQGLHPKIQSATQEHGKTIRGASRTGYNGKVGIKTMHAAEESLRKRRVAMMHGVGEARPGGKGNQGQSLRATVHAAGAFSCQVGHSAEPAVEMKRNFGAAAIHMEAAALVRASIGA
jgi:hypothetical protein